MKSKKVIAFALATILALGGTVTALADGITGTGTNTGSLDEDVYTAIVPGESAAEIYNFFADPERLILRSGQIISGSGASATSAAAAGTRTTADANGIYFKSDNGYSNVSSCAAIELHNYSDFTVGVDVEVTEAGDIPLTGTTDLLNDGSATVNEGVVSGVKTGSSVEMYLGLRVVTGAATATSTVTGTAITTAGVSHVVSCPGAIANYEVVVTGSGTSAKYALKERSNADANKWNVVKFDLVGAVNYVKIDDSIANAPSIKLTWNIEKDGGAISGFADVVGPVNGSNWLGMKKAEGDAGKFADNATITKVTVNGVDVTSKAQKLYGWVAVSVPDMRSAGIAIDGVTPLKAVFTVDGKTYKATYNY